MNTIKKLLILFVLLLAGSNITYAQTLKAWVTAGDNSMEKLSYAEAIEYYNKALEFETEDLNLYFKVAEACRLYKDYERAAAWYGKILVTDRGERFPMAMFRYAEMKKYLGMYEESGRIYERYVTAFPGDTSYFGVKARKEITDCKLAIEMAKKKPEAAVRNAGTPVNTVYSDFGARMMGDTVLYYSSLKFLYETDEKKKDDYYVSRILMSRSDKGKSTQPVPLGILFNDAPTHNCNVAFSPNYKLMVFTRCAQSEEFNLNCELYLSKSESGKWGKPVKLGTHVNMEGFTSTHPAIEARGADGYTLYFVSDRPGGKGKLDIWKSDFNAAMEFSPAVNLGETINTFDDEMTPFFDTPNQTLYFSSYGHTGLGGMDIFKSINNNGTFSTPENMGPGYNTSVNDVYYTINNDNQSGTLSSNRPGSMFIRSKTCCYDIYYYNVIKTDSVPAIVKDTTVVVAVAPKAPVTAVDEVTQLATRSYYDEFLPLQIYFDNDEPDKRTMAVKTKKHYENLYKDYIARIPDY
ncbi:MAG TPA: tetratricopeptide repeat protein, partial [Bacteroidia bacterium]|nr:tetratricopeptide repeat protein [Bacteroidia bacterium]